MYKLTKIQISVSKDKMSSPGRIQLEIPRSLGEIGFIIFYNMFSMCYNFCIVVPESPLMPLVPDMAMSLNLDNDTGITNSGDMTRVDETIRQEPLIKIKSLLPEDHTFKSFKVSSASIMKMLSPAQIDSVVDMLAKGSYVR